MKFIEIHVAGERDETNQRNKENRRNKEKVENTINRQLIFRKEYIHIVIFKYMNMNHV